MIGDVKSVLKDFQNRFCLYNLDEKSRNLNFYDAMLWLKCYIGIYSYATVQHVFGPWALHNLNQRYCAAAYNPQSALLHSLYSRAF